MSQALLSSLNAGTAHFSRQDQDALQELIQFANDDGNLGQHNEKSHERDLIEGSKQQQKGFDPFQMMESVRQGVRLDLGLTPLHWTEVKLIALVLAGISSVDDVAPLVLMAMQSGHGLSQALAAWRLEGEKVRSSHRKSQTFRQQLQPTVPRTSPPAISVLNLSYAYIGNTGVELLSEFLHSNGNCLKTLDMSFCGIEERGFLALAKALTKRKRKEIDPLIGLILSGNHITPRAASELGGALAVATRNSSKRAKNSRHMTTGGYETDSSDDEEDDDDDTKRYGSQGTSGGRGTPNTPGIHVLHLANTSLNAKSLRRLLDGMGATCTVRELNLSSNNLGAKGAAALVQFLEGQIRSRDAVPLPFLDRMDMSNNDLGDDGTTQLTRVIIRRSQVHFVDLRLSSNAITAGGVETLMNKLLQHDLISLSLDKNAIGDQGCKLVAASLQSMKSLSRLNLSFNQISSRGITSLMRSLMACESITYLGLSGNILKISGAVALAFTLSQHPRLEELHLDNCCLGQAAQCHIVAGIISNRWVPMKRLKGYALGPPMVAIGALQPYAQNLSNEECLRIRKDEQMKANLRWMETNRLARQSGKSVERNQPHGTDSGNVQFLTPEYVESFNDASGAPPQELLYRLLNWLGRIPFDDDELTMLQKYFYDTDGGEGDRGSDGYINLKLRGDLLAALDGEIAEEIREELPSLAPVLEGSVGIALDKLENDVEWDEWDAFRSEIADKPAVYIEREVDDTEIQNMVVENEEISCLGQSEEESDMDDSKPTPGDALSRSKSMSSVGSKDKRSNKPKARITMFPEFEQQLERLKTTAAEMIEQEDDPVHHEVILTQYAEASLTVLRQLKYRCMQSGYDGWRQGSHKRKILVVDDSKLTRKLIARAFEKAGFIVDTAKNGVEGVEKLKASIYDIAFSKAWLAVYCCLFGTVTNLSVFILPRSGYPDACYERLRGHEKTKRVGGQVSTRM
jgi:Ran GTPase-activating protein (RanGAP) involved in mRNA processing and transport